MTSPRTANVRRVDVASVLQVSRAKVALLAAIVVVACAAYCSGYTLLVGGVVHPVLSITWGVSTVAPWVVCWPLLRRAVLRVGTDGARWSSVLGWLGLAAVVAAVLERAAALLFGAEHGLPLAELVFR